MTPAPDPTGFMQDVAWAWMQDVAPATKLVLFALSEQLQNPDLGAIGRKCGMAKRTVQYHLQRLKDRGIIASHEGGYRLVMQDVAHPMQDVASPAAQHLAAQDVASTDLLLRGRGSSPEQFPLEQDPSPPPAWLSIFRERDPRWAKVNANGLIQDVESRFPSVDLEWEAKKACRWLQERGKNKTVRGMPRFWISWLERAQRGPAEHQGGSTRVELAQGRPFEEGEPGWENP